MPDSGPFPGSDQSVTGTNNRRTDRPRANRSRNGFDLTPKRVGREWRRPGLDPIQSKRARASTRTNAYERPQPLALPKATNSSSAKSIVGRRDATQSNQGPPLDQDGMGASIGLVPWPVPHSAHSRRHVTGLFGWNSCRAAAAAAAARLDSDTVQLPLPTTPMAAGCG